MDLPDPSCGAKQGQWITGETDISCEVCNVFLFNNLHIGEEEIIDTDADADDMEDDYVDDVTVAEAEIDINTTPEEGKSEKSNGRFRCHKEPTPIGRISSHQKLRRLHTDKSFRYSDNILGGARVQEIFHHRNRHARKDDDSYSGLL